MADSCQCMAKITTICFRSKITIKINKLKKKKRVCLHCRRPWFNSWVQKIPWKRDGLPTPVFMDFPGGSVNKESACNGGNLGSIPGLGRSHGGGHGNPLQYSCLENPHEQRSLVGYSLWSRKNSDTTEQSTKHRTAQE